MIRMKIGKASGTNCLASRAANQVRKIRFGLHLPLQEGRQHRARPAARRHDHPVERPAVGVGRDPHPVGQLRDFADALRPSPPSRRSPEPRRRRKAQRDPCGGSPPGGPGRRTRRATAGAAGTGAPSRRGRGSRRAPRCAGSSPAGPGCTARSTSPIDRPPHWVRISCPDSSSSSPPEALGQLEHRVEVVLAPVGHPEQAGVAAHGAAGMRRGHRLEADRGRSPASRPARAPCSRRCRLRLTAS